MPRASSTCRCSAARARRGGNALQAERDEQERERHRLWYVAATRARDLLLLPEFSTGVPKGSWMDQVGLRLDGLTAFDTDRLAEGSLNRTEEPPNRQDRAQFETEAALIASRTHRILRITPHLAEAGARPNERAMKLAYCRRMAPAAQTAAGCGAVFQSLSTTPETR